MAAERGHTDAQYNIGLCYYQGRSVEQSYADAAKWWKKAAEQGHAYAQYNLGMCYLKSLKYKEAMIWFEKAAEQEQTLAKNFLEINKIYKPMLTISLYFIGFLIIIPIIVTLVIIYFFVIKKKRHNKIQI